jgi:alpha(1,3/1,4) fucosyltransferase
MKKVLKINFCDFWADLDKQENLFTKLLSPHFDLELSDDPDVLFYSCYSFNHLKYKCHKIFYTGEAVAPDFRECDFAISFEWDKYDGKNLRLPFFRWSPSLTKLYQRSPSQEIAAAKSKFCCMVISNGDCKERNDFFHKLNEYKKVDSGGGFMNNIGYQVPDKVTFAKDYKFIIAFENSSYPGYTTEKIFQPMLVDCLPIYWGNPVIDRDFNTQSFINVHNYNTHEEVIKEIIRLDNDNQAYCHMLDQPFFTGNKMPVGLELDYLSDKLKDAVCSFENTLPIASHTCNRVYEYAHMYKKRFFARVYKKQHWYC